MANNLFKNYIWENHGFLKIILTVICIYLLVEPFNLYLVEKPTLATSIQDDFKLEDFPYVSVCPEPKVNTTMVTSYGYFDHFSYRDGVLRNISENDAHVGWNGDESEDIQEVVRQISPLKSPKVCPKGMVWYKSKHPHKDSEMIEMKFELTRAIFPDHLC